MLLSLGTARLRPLSAAHLRTYLATARHPYPIDPIQRYATVQQLSSGRHKLYRFASHTVFPSLMPLQP